ncbi:ubiquitin carboxyl-terminal hydrolase UCH54-like [Drosophila eugracilis]|uniref:ubiquitin carboxyl-terminal hydrolase UCH54-like n=1 Tax=Drosophila eugracilis TaxID=29029 RepID=UPI001BDA4292|nr:ubiquitin carboxyl-terminal hydrolase UCH54-like [Drosophila eugracilis]
MTKGAALPTPTALMLDTKQRALPNDNQTTCEVQQQHQKHSSSSNTSNTNNNNNNNNNAQVTVGAALIWPR